MIPIVSISNAIAGVFSLLLTIKTGTIYRKRREPYFRDFFYFLLFFTLYMLFLAVPGLISNNTKVVTFSQIIAQIFLHFAAAFFISVPFLMFNLQKLRIIYFLLLLASLLLLIGANIVDFEYSSLVTKKNFYHWMVFREKKWLRFEIGIIIGISALSGIFLFFKKGLKSTDPIVKKRSIFLGGGMFCLLLASGLNYIAGSKLELPLMLAGSLSALSAMALMFLATKS